MVGMLRFLSIGNQPRVLVRGVRSELIGHTVGLWQDIILSPLLYAADIDSLVNGLSHLANWCLEGLPVGVFFYAYDITLISKDAAPARRLLWIFGRHALTHGFASCQTSVWHSLVPVQNGLPG